MYNIHVAKKLNIRVKEICRWMSLNDIKHGPTTIGHNGWMFHLYNMEDTVTFKMVWNGELLWVDREKEK